MSWVRMSSPARARAGELFTDLSSNNGANGFHAAQYASAGHLLAMLKATESLRYVNPFWAGWVDDAHRHGLGVAHYHFCNPAANDPVGEARHFWDTVRARFKPGVDRLVIDLETGDPATWAAYLKQLDDELVRYSTLEAILYTFASGISSGVRVRSGKYQIAAWGPNQPSGPFRKLSNGGSLWAWQYTNGVIDPAGGPVRLAGAGDGATVDVSVLNPATVRSLRQHLHR